MTVLITGCGGFIGSHLTERLLNENEIVIGVDNFDDFYDPSIKTNNLKNSLENENFFLIRSDIRDQEEIKRIFENNNIKTVIHLAARAGVRPSIQDPLLYEDVNIKGTLNILEALKDISISKGNCPNLAFASSSSVYGNNEKVPFAENDPVDHPISPYAASKKACEMYCYTYHHLYGIPVTCLRFFTVYGPRQRPEMAIHKFTRAIDRGETITMYGDGTTERDYTYIEDIIEGVMAASRIRSGYEILNLGNSNTVKLRYLIQLIEDRLGKKALINEMPIQPGDVNRTFADITKAKQLLDYEPLTPIEKGIDLFIDWYEKEKNDTF